MRTAEEIATKIISSSVDCSPMDMYVRMINEARKEAIEECAEKAELDLTDNYKGCEISKKPFLDLIDDLK